MSSTTITVTPDTDCCILQMFLLEDETIKFETWCLSRAWKNSMSKLCEVRGGQEQSFTCKELYVGDASLQH